MLIPLFWAIVFVELPEAWDLNVRRQHRWKKGCCAACGHLRSGINDNNDHLCQECGGVLEPPVIYQLSLGTVKRFAVILAFGWVLGIGTGETWLRLDGVHASQQKSLQLKSPSSSAAETRQRVWPGWAKSDFWPLEFGSQ